MPPKAATTHVLIDNELILYERERSSIWQCRYKVDGVWQRATTKERDLKKARRKARELLITAEIRKRDNLPVITRKFRNVAELALKRMEDAIAAGQGIVSFNDYIRVIKDYLTPFFGNYSIANIDRAAIDQFETWRTEKMGKTPTRSTVLTHNAALNRVFDEAVIRNFLSDVNRPKLEAKGKKSDRRPAFDLTEIQALLGSFESWIAKARNDRSKEWRLLMRDYVHVLVDTGARPGDELMNLKWKQIKFGMKPTQTKTGVIAGEGPDEPPEDPSEKAPSENPNEIVLTNLNRSCEMTVTGKTGTRQILGMSPTVKALVRIIERNYDIKTKIVDPFKEVAAAFGDDYVFRTKAKEKPNSLQKMFEEFLKDYDLLIDPRTEQKRVFYSLRHTYATLALTHDQVPIHTLAKQMGTSVLMIEKHYSHLKVVQAIEQLRGYETRRLIAAGSVIEPRQQVLEEVAGPSAKPKRTGKRAAKSRASSAGELQ
jgi:integrase